MVNTALNRAAKKSGRSFSRKNVKEMLYLAIHESNTQGTAIRIVKDGFTVAADSGRLSIWQMKRLV